MNEASFEISSIVKSAPEWANYIKVNNVKFKRVEEYMWAYTFYIRVLFSNILLIFQWMRM